MVRCLPLILILVPFSGKAGCWFICEPLLYKFTQRGFYMQCQLRCFSSPVIIDLPGDDGVPGDDSNVGGGGGDDDNSPPPPPPQQKLDCIDQIITHDGVIHRFGEPTITPSGETRPHSGVDMAAPNGTPIRSPISGFVSHFRGDLETNEQGNTDEGNYIQINALHEQAFDSDGNYIPGRIQSVILAHLDYHFGRRLNLSPGKKINAGDVIAYSDNTGKIIGVPPHLHLSIWEDKRADPLNQFPENCGGQ